MNAANRFDELLEVKISENFIRNQLMSEGYTITNYSIVIYSDLLTLVIVNVTFELYITLIKYSCMCKYLNSLF